MSVAAAAREQVELQKAALQALRQARARIESLERATREPMAVIGLACRFPGEANTPDAYWQLLRSGTDAITEVPADRWDIDSLYDADPQAPGKMTTRSGGFLRQVDQFDPRFFGISPREAMRMDPQQRLVLEVGWEAIERAGLATDRLAGTQTGVFLGASTCDYSLLGLKAPGALLDADLYQVTGSATNIIAGRLSYTLGLRGPAMVVDTACSSALVAVHLAIQSLRAGECDLALAGGVSLMLAPELSVMFSKAHMLAPDGRCKTFDAAADGFARGEGCGVIVLRRLSDAVAQGDPILALVRGSAINQDGRSSGLTAPNGQAQQAVIRQALANAHVSPADIGYVETHGTGTVLGDPVEVQALAAVLREGRSPDDPVRMGAVKTNIGHLEAAAGIASLIKAVLVLQRREIPPNLHLHDPNPHVPWDALPVTAPTELVPWRAGDRPRLAGVSSFGFSGTNAHVILAEAPADPPRTEPSSRPLYLLGLSAKDGPALRELAGRYQRHLAASPSVALADFTQAANTGRAHLSHRAALVAGSPAQMQDRLGALADSSDGRADPTAAQDNPPIAFLFTGQGSQYAGMGRRLYDTLPVFRSVLDNCNEILRAHLDRSLLSVLYPEAGAEAPLDDTTYTQPALFAVEYALAQVWRSWGIVPSGVLGHSVGEYVAACVAGVFSLEDALELIAHRARLMGALPRNGAMAAVFAAEGEVAAAVAPYRQALAIAAVNGPESTVISGAIAAVEAVTAALRARGTRVEPLTVSHAFHSPLMDPVLDSLERLAAAVPFAEPQIDLVSNLTGQRVAPATTLDGRYLRRHAREAVRFQDGMATLRRLGYGVFLEIGPRPVLLELGRRLPATDAGVWLPSLRRNRDDGQSMLDSLGALYTHGAAVDWGGVDSDFPARRAVLPTYPFQRQSYWFPPRARKPSTAEAGSPAAADGLDPHAPASWLYRTNWRAQPATPLGAPTPDLAGHWVILADAGGLGRRLAGLLEAGGGSVELMYADAWQPDSDETRSALTGCRAVIHLWGLDGTPSAADLTAETLRRDQERHCASVLRLVGLLAAAGGPGNPRLWIVTRGAQSVRHDGDQVNVTQAPLWGLGKVIALEHPELWGGLLDLDPRPATPSATEADAAAEARGLMADVCGPRARPYEGQLAWRDGQRYVARLTRAEGVLASPVPMRPDVTYAVTGGLGALGGDVAAWLVRQGARHIALLSRRPGADSPTVRALEVAGARVLAIQADVAQSDQVARALEEIEANMPPLRGIVHAAGVLDDGLLMHQEWASFERVLAPKVEGAWNLHVSTLDVPLDFFVLFSSAASLLGSPGQGSYAAGNAFLDALAHHRRQSGQPALAINWGPWSEVGMAARADAASSRRWAERGLGLLAPEQAIGALAALLNGPASQVAVLRADWTKLASATDYEAAGCLPALLAEQTEQALWDKPPARWRPAELRPLARLLALTPGQRPGFLRDTLQHFAADVLGMVSQDVPVECDLLELGLDSLMVIEVTRSIQRDFELLLYPKELYEHPTITALAGYLDAELLKAHTTGQAERTRRTASPPKVATAAISAERTAPPKRQHAESAQPAASRPSPLPGIVFLLSSPRSGSTLLRVMLAGHPQLFCPPELHLLAFDRLGRQREDLDDSYLQEGLQRALMELRGCDAVASKAMLDDWSADDLSVPDVYDRLRHMAAPRLLLDKSPTYAGSMDTLCRSQELFADASYLYLVRHPYAAIESFVRTRMHKLVDVGAGWVGEEDPFLVAEQVWVQTNQNMVEFLRQVDPRRQHTIRYEDLVRRPEDSIDHICAFLGIATDSAVLRPYDGARMTDGVHGRSRSIGDPNFLTHDRIEADLADAWREVSLPGPLGPAAQELAARFDYPLTEPAGRAPTRPAGDGRSRAAAPPGPPEARESSATVRGLRLSVNTWGPEGGPALVCLHGILDHGMAWEDVAIPLAALGYRVIAPDQRGHGCSAHAPAGTYQLLDYVADLDALLDGPLAERTEPVMLVGHSMGAAVAATFASLRPERVSGLVLVEGLVPGEAAEDDFASQLASRLDYLVSVPTHAVLPDTSSAADRLRQATPSLAADLAQRMAVRITQTCDGGVCWRWDAALLTRADLTYDSLSLTPARFQTLLSRITAPVTLVYGRSDHPQLAQLREILPRATAEVLPGGHNLHVDAPTALADTIARSAARAGVVPGA